MEARKRNKGLGWLVATSAILGALATWNLTSHPRSPRLTPDSLAAAKSKWSAAGIKDYAMTVVVLGRDEDEHEIEVHGGKVTRMLTDSVMAPDRVWDDWSVDGILAILEQELANASRPEGPFGVADPRDVFLDASFDGVTGAPIHYLRQVSGNSRLTMEWEIREFRKL